MSLPASLLVAWLGDDFTGSAATMEALSFAGVPAVLFADIPTEDQLAQFPGARAIGIATTARTHDPVWMEQHLPPLFSFLKETGAAIVHYKVCSTLDSAPHIGSIGKALDLGAKVVGEGPIPFLVAAPQMKRYQAFGHLFAGASDGAVYRLDRHAVMSRHPVTPMHEAHVATHLSEQTARPVSTLSRENKSDVIPEGAGIVTLDAVDEADMARNGALIWSLPHPVLVGGSQGIEYALISHWRAAELIETTDVTAGAGEVERIIAVSGSVSPTTAEQIVWAGENGFAVIELDAAAVALGDDGQALARDAMSALSKGLDPLICTARGPDDPSVARFGKALAQAGITTDEANARIGATLGRILRQLLENSGVKRAVISGGDTSGHACRELDVFAFTALAPTIPGAGLLEAHSNNPALKGLQLALKGGQMGSRDYFGWIKRGGGMHREGREQ